MNPDLLFVYGTLRRNCPGGAHQQYLAGARFIANARVRGRLYQVSYYPALVLGSDQENSWVTGEVYRLAGVAQLQMLDVYEECDYPALPEQEYQRRLCDLVTDAGETIQAWIYAWQRPVSGLPLIASGDFLNP